MRCKPILLIFDPRHTPKGRFKETNMKQNKYFSQVFFCRVPYFTVCVWWGEIVDSVVHSHIHPAPLNHFQSESIEITFVPKDLEGLSIRLLKGTSFVGVVLLVIHLILPICLSEVSAQVHSELFLWLCHAKGGKEVGWLPFSSRWSFGDVNPHESMSVILIHKIHSKLVDFLLICLIWRHGVALSEMQQAPSHHRIMAVLNRIHRF